MVRAMPSLNMQLKKGIVMCFMPKRTSPALIRKRQIKYMFKITTGIKDGKPIILLKFSDFLLLY